MPFVKPPRTLQRFRKMFKCNIVGPPGAADTLAELVKVARRVTSRIIDAAVEGNGGEWIPSTHRRKRADLYKELIATFDANGLPTSSGPSQMFACKDRADDIALAPLVFGNRAKSLKEQQEVEVFARGTSIALKCGKTDKAKTITIEVDEVPGPEWFVQAAEVLPNGTINLIVTRSRDSVEKDRAEGGGKRKRRRTRRPVVKPEGKTFAMVGSTLYLISVDDGAKIRDRFSNGKTVNDEVLDRVRDWIRKNGEAIGDVEVKV